MRDTVESVRAATEEEFIVLSAAARASGIDLRSVFVNTKGKSSTPKPKGRKAVSKVTNMLTIRTDTVEEYQAIAEAARSLNGISINQFCLDAIREALLKITAPESARTGA